MLMFDTEEGLWNFLGEQWSEPVMVDVGNKDEKKRPTPAIIPVVSGNANYGLCRSLVQMHEGKAIDFRTFSKAKARLDNYLAKVGWNGAYLFGLDLNGAILRADLCRQFAKAAKHDREQETPGHIPVKKK